MSSLISPLSGIDLGRFQPYIGAGVGVARNSLGEMTYLFPENTRRHKVSVTPDGERTNFAYRLAIGTGYALTETIALDLSAHYIDLGEVGTDAGRLTMNTLPADVTRYRTRPCVGFFVFEVAGTSDTRTKKPALGRFFVSSCFVGGRRWDRTTDPCRVKTVLSR